MPKRSQGAPKLKWTEEEELALKAGVDKHGAGKWRTIQKDVDFARQLRRRSNVDLKDKWRNLTSESAIKQGKAPLGTQPRPRVRRSVAAKPKVQRRSLPPRWPECGGINAGVASNGPERMRRTTSQAAADAAAAILVAASGRVSSCSPDGQAYTDENGGDGGTQLLSWGASSARSGAVAAKPTNDYNARADSIITSAVESLQELAGSSSDDITNWISEHYEVDDMFWDGLRPRLERMVTAGQLVTIAGPTPRYRLPQMNRLDTMALMAAWQHEVERGGGASAHSAARQEDAFEAAHAAARVVMDAMEAESAAGRATPSAGGQPLEAIQLFEQADSKEVAVRPREEILSTLARQPGLANLDTYLKRQQQREALQHAREFLRQHSQQGQHDPFALQQHALSGGQNSLGVNGAAEVAGRQFSGMAGMGAAALPACGPLEAGLRAAPDLNLPPPIELDVPLVLPPPPQLILKGVSSLPSSMLHAFQSRSSLIPSSLLPSSFSSAPQMTASSVRVKSG